MCLKPSYHSYELWDLGQINVFESQLYICKVTVMVFPKVVMVGRGTSDTNNCVHVLYLSKMSLIPNVRAGNLSTPRETILPHLHPHWQVSVSFWW